MNIPRTAASGNQSKISMGADPRGLLAAPGLRVIIGIVGLRIRVE
jgi:hypothetical protein